MIRRLRLSCCVFFIFGCFSHNVTADEILRTAADRPIDILHIRLDLGRFSEIENSFRDGDD